MCKTHIPHCLSFPGFLTTYLKLQYVCILQANEQIPSKPTCVFTRRSVHCPPPLPHITPDPPRPCHAEQVHAPTPKPHTGIPIPISCSPVPHGTAAHMSPPHAARSLLEIQLPNPPLDGGGAPRHTDTAAPAFAQYLAHDLAGDARGRYPGTPARPGMPAGEPWGRYPWSAPGAGYPRQPIPRGCCL